MANQEQSARIVNVRVMIGGPGIEGLVNECCYEGENSMHSLETAYLLQNTPGFEHLDEEEIARREEICSVAESCDFSRTGECALRAAGFIKD